MHNSFSQKILTRAIFLLAPAANIFATSQFPIGCMERQHAAILESICETNSIKYFNPAERTGLLTPFLTCFTLLFRSILLGPKNSKSKFTLFFALLGQKNSKSKSKTIKSFYDNSIFCLNRKIIPSLQNYSKSHFLSGLWQFPLLAYPFHTLATGV